MDMKSQCIRSTKINAVSAIAGNDFPFIATMMLSCTHTVEDGGHGKTSNK